MQKQHGCCYECKKVGELIEAGKVPPHLSKLGSTKEELFWDLPELRGIYGDTADEFSTGAIGVYSYLNRIGYGLQHFAALNRKFDISYADQPGFDTAYAGCVGSYQWVLDAGTDKVNIRKAFHYIRPIVCG